MHLINGSLDSHSNIAFINFDLEGSMRGTVDVTHIFTNFWKRKIPYVNTRLNFDFNILLIYGIITSNHSCYLMTLDYSVVSFS